MPTSPIPRTLRKLAVPVAELKPYAHNPRRGDLELVQASLRRHGQYRPIVCRQGSFEVLAGNHTYLAARELGWEKIAAVFISVSDEEAARIVLADNRTSDLAYYDRPELAELLSSLAEPADGTGYTESDIAGLLAEVAALDVPQLEREREPGGAAPQAFVKWGTKDFFLTPAEQAGLDARLDWWLERSDGQTLGFISWLLAGCPGLELSRLLEGEAA